MSCISESVLSILSEIAEAARQSGRAREDITVLAAAKTQSADAVKEALRAGVDGVGENRVQEFRRKLAEGAYASARVDFIGALQTNKVKYLVGEVALIQSVDSERLARALSDCAVKRGVVQPVLLEVNIGREESKAGVMPENLLSLAETLLSLPGLKLRGLMAIPPVGKPSRPYFSAMREMFERLKGVCPEADTLSMGMSQDYIEAVKEGSTLVRIGTAIFGPRVKP
jgi:pyridoxal phosphate enzyme (YggS family)